MTTPYIGQIMLFAGTFAPKGWAFCQGQILPIAQNQALFAILGTTYGGNGTTTFALPDLRGRVPLGTGQAPGSGTNYQPGQTVGSESTTLTVAQIPSHAHSVAVTMDATPGSTSAPAANTGNIAQVVLAAGRPPTLAPSFTTGTPAAPVALNPTTSGVQGGSQPHSNLQPSMAMNYIIALQGVFPSRN
ncbi:phage tail protein [Methylobacterium sp. JK268]